MLCVSILSWGWQLNSAFESESKLDEMLDVIGKWNRACKAKRGRYAHIELGAYNTWQATYTHSNGSFLIDYSNLRAITKAKVQYLPSGSSFGIIDGFSNRAMDEILASVEADAWEAYSDYGGSSRKMQGKKLALPKDRGKHLKFSGGVKASFFDTPRSDVKDFTRSLHDKLVDRGCFGSWARTKLYVIREFLVDGYGTNILQDHSRMMVTVGSEECAKDTEDRKVKMLRSVGGFGGGELLKSLSGRAGSAANEMAEKAKLFKNVKSKVSGLKLTPGLYKAVLGGSVGGVAMHELGVGHLTEASRLVDEDETSLAIFGNLGKQVSTGELNIIDDSQLMFNGARPFSWYKWDSEGVEGKRTYLIRRGVLSGLLHTKESAGTLSDMIKTELTGNGRAANIVEDISGYGCHDDEERFFEPESRMSTLHVMPSKNGMSLEEMLEEVAGKGIYLAGQGSGYVFTEVAQGEINFQEAYFVDKNANLVPIKAAYFSDLRPGLNIGSTAMELMSKIKGVGNNSTLEVDDGYCGSNSGWVPHTIISPALLFEDLPINVKKPEDQMKPPLIPHRSWSRIKK